MLKPLTMLVALIVAGPALAGGETQSAAAKAKDPKRKICEAVEETGSRLSSKRICLTAEQWAVQRGEKRPDSQRSDSQRSERASGDRGSK